MRKLFVGFLLLFITTLTNAQQGLHAVNVGVDFGLPIGDFGKAYGIGLGATGKAMYAITDQSDITGTLGYLRFGMKEDSNFMSGSMSMIPIMFGYKHRFGEWYGEPQLGLHILKSNVKVKDSLGWGLSGIRGSTSTTKVSFGLGGGYMFSEWDLGFRFQIIDNMNFLGIRLAYNFSL